MKTGMLRVGRLAGIPLAIHPLWFVVVALLTAVLGGSYFPSAVPGIAPWVAYALGLATVLGLFASVIAHELGHALVARRDGVEIEEIDLWPLGGISRMRELPATPAAELRMALAGPAVSVMLAVALAGIALVLPLHGALAPREAVGYLAGLNAILAAFNLVPALPLDGGRVAHALLWKRSGDRDQATVRAAVTGRWFGWLFVAIGAGSWMASVAPGPWLALIGAYVLVSAKAEERGAIVHQTFDGVPVRRLMTTEPDVVSEFATVRDAAEQLSLHRHTALPVVNGNGVAIGLVSITDVARVSAHQRQGSLVGTIAHREPGLLVAPGADVAALLQTPAFAAVGRAIVVDRQGRPVGVVSITDVQRELRSVSVLGPDAHAA